MIPKIIHQTHPNPNKLPSEILENIDFLKSNNPTWDYRIYSNEFVMEYLEKNLDKNHFNLLEKLNPKYGVVLADIFRYVIIKQEGGVYLDVKSTCVVPLDSFIKENDEFLISQWENKLGEMYTGAGIHPELSMVHGGEFQQWFIIANKNHPFLTEVIDRIMFNIKNYHTTLSGVGKIGVLRLSGPIVYTKCIFSMLGKHPFRIVNSRHIGLRYSIYDKMGYKNFHMQDPSHYSKLRESIVLN